MLNPPTFVEGRTLDDVIYKALYQTMNNGKVVESRNGSATFLNDLNLQLSDARERHLSLRGRTSNIFQLIGETLWILSGSNEIKPFLEVLLPRAENYSDDGETWRGGYGPRMVDHNQMESLFEIFRTDGKNTRRAIVQIADPSIDSLSCVYEEFGVGYSPKDIPCNREIHFFITDDELHAKVIQRSGDLLFGAGSINPFEFSYILEIVYNSLLSIFPELKLGVLRWAVTNAHVYSQHYKQVEDILDLYPKAFIEPLSERITFLPEYQYGDNRDTARVYDLRTFKAEYDKLCEIVTLTKRGADKKFVEDAVTDLFRISGFGSEKVDIHTTYLMLVVGYILGKFGYSPKLSFPSIPASLFSAVKRSKFLNFDIVLGTSNYNIEFV